MQKQVTITIRDGSLIWSDKKVEQPYDTIKEFLRALVNDDRYQKDLIVQSLCVNYNIDIIIKDLELEKAIEAKTTDSCGSYGNTSPPYGSGGGNSPYGSGGGNSR